MSCITQIIKVLTLRVQIALSLRQDLNIIVSLASIGKPNMIIYNPTFAVCIMHAVINDNIINNNNLVIC